MASLPYHYLASSEGTSFNSHSK
ncbi:hypothetical protein CCACVL1_06632 [Corchorus capsularis]|uniref:Uncharacterized protein n=1 Tax=Corchorus capsularis TaxID=210143 RepID=A0A1R3JE43_COCAP|nr:hypothetical protein CCACVL1_06632 [Corchorus capsularis]